MEQFQISGNLVKQLQFVKWNKKTQSALADIYPSCQSTSEELQLNYFWLPFSYMDHVPPHLIFHPNVPPQQQQGLVWFPRTGHGTEDAALLEIWAMEEN